MEYLFILGRVLLGGYFMMAGFNHFKMKGMMTGYAASKGIPMPGASVVLTGLMMLAGGLGVLLGVYVTWSVYLLALFLLVASFKMHNFWSMEGDAKMDEMRHFMKNLALMGAVLMLLSIPLPWAMALM